MRVSACDSGFMYFPSLLILVFKELTGGGLSQVHGTGNAHDLGFRVLQTLKVCKIMAFMAIIMGLGLLFYILFGVQVLLTELLGSPPGRSRVRLLKQCQEVLRQHEVADLRKLQGFRV